jgi:DNA repair protein RadA/Sms
MKSTKAFACKECGNQFTKWVGKCPCGSFQIKEVELKESYFESTVVVQDDSEELEQITCSIEEFNRVCGIFKKSVMVIGGEPGIGKSTLMGQIAKSFDGICLYLTGEEATGNVNKRIKRIAKDKFENNKVIIHSFFIFEELKGLLEKYKPEVVILDSIHTTRMAHEETNQLREMILNISMISRSYNCCIIVVSHITKEGIISGPKTIEHMVDVVLYLEGDRYGQLRLLRSIKNRFGPTNETGVFEMKEDGLIEVSNPSALFISQRRQGVPGSVIFAGINGSRPFLIEVQALVVDSSDAHIESVGFDQKRLKMILAILSKWCNLNFVNKDIFVNFVGGMKIFEPAADLAVAMAILSAHKNRTISAEVCFIGELGLTGEIRRVVETDLRVKEALRLGFKRIYCRSDNPSVFSVSVLGDLIDML